jgi:WD repeat-containing protein 44
MTGTSLLPSIKISKSGGSETKATDTPLTTPITPTSEPESDRERSSSPVAKDGVDGTLAHCSIDSWRDTDGRSPLVSSPKATNGLTKPPNISILPSDPERLQSPTKTRSKGNISSLDNATTVDPLTIQILRRTGTENTLRQRLRKDSYDDSIKGEGFSGSGERGPVDATRNTDAQPQGKDRKFVFALQPYGEFPRG